MNNQHFSGVCIGCDLLGENEDLFVPHHLVTKGIQAATGHKIGHTRI
jgi:hypothetical protein